MCSEAELYGDITIGRTLYEPSLYDIYSVYDTDTGTVVHPSAHILAEGGPIVIGENNLIQEQVTIINW